MEINEFAKFIKRYKEPIYGWFWNDDKRRAVYLRLSSFHFEIFSEYRYEASDSKITFLFKNFSLANPNIKRFISTTVEAVKWSKRHTNRIIKQKGITGVALAKNCWFVEPSDFYVSLNVENTKWKKLTEFKVDDDS